MSHSVIYITGVSGSGKTTIGQQLSVKTGFPFYDADDFHPQKNIDKMKSGLPLTDEDRWPWLDIIHSFVIEKLNATTIIVACSALKQTYRQRLSAGLEQQCIWVFLNGNFSSIAERMKKRSAHFMPAALLQSQFDALEIPADAIDVDISKTPTEITDYIISKLKKLPN